MNTEEQQPDWMGLDEPCTENHKGFLRQSHHINGKGSRTFIDSLHRTHRSHQWVRRGRFSHQVWFISNLAVEVWQDEKKREAWMIYCKYGKRLLGI